MDYYISPTDCADWYAGGRGRGSTCTPRGGTGPTMLATDFDMLFRAVGERLRLSIQTDTPLLFTSALECADALEQLHQILIQDRTPQTGWSVSRTVHRSRDKRAALTPASAAQ